MLLIPWDIIWSWTATEISFTLVTAAGHLFANGSLLRTTLTRCDHVVFVISCHLQCNLSCFVFEIRLQRTVSHAVQMKDKEPALCCHMTMARFEKQRDRNTCYRSSILARFESVLCKLQRERSIATNNFKFSYNILL